MRRAMIAVALSVLGVAVIAPAAQGRQEERFFQDPSLTGSFPGQIFFIPGPVLDDIK